MKCAGLIRLLEVFIDFGLCERFGFTFKKQRPTFTDEVAQRGLYGFRSKSCSLPRVHSDFFGKVGAQWINNNAHCPGTIWPGVRDCDTDSDLERAVIRGLCAKAAADIQIWTNDHRLLPAFLTSNDQLEARVVFNASLSKLLLEVIACRLARR